VQLYSRLPKNWPPDANRVYRGTGKGTFAEVVRAVEILHDCGVRFGILAVISHQSLGRAREICDFFVSCGIRSFEFLPCFETDPETTQLTEHSVTPAECGEFLCEAFGWWITRDDPTVEIVYLLNILVGLLGGRPSKCKLNGSCGRYLTVGADGTVWPCDRFVGVEQFRLGNLREQLLREILEGEPRKQFLQQTQRLPPECRDCRYFPVCRGGCRWLRFQTKLLGMEETLYCEVNRQLFDRAVSYLAEAKPGYHVPWREISTVGS